MGFHETKAFESEQGLAVSLPDALGIRPGERFAVERSGRTIIITPLETESPEQVRERMRRLLEDMQKIGAPSDGVQERDPFEFPDRPGL